ncbi:hypothetical protein AB0C51_10670 [Streptomyces pathocidini]|uniref:Uncharacterized protein n=1 Tax=Streptomyces pathocidini TaxID=1650571 RepID=A0ABW7UX82_9ACTN|nr:hypothetical protein [Streptomyces pathocidini]
MRIRTPLLAPFHAAVFTGLLIAASLTPVAYAADRGEKKPETRRKGHHLANAQMHGRRCHVPSGYDPHVIATVWRIGQDYEVSEKVMLAGFEAGWVESHMNNLDCGDKDSLGVFQQRPSYGWGTPAQILDPAHAAARFFSRALARDYDNPDLTPGELAQAVQRSAFPGRYDDAEYRARAMMDEVADGYWDEDDGYEDGYDEGDEGYFGPPSRMGTVVTDLAKSHVPR